MSLKFSGPVWFWKGPAPWYFVSLPEYEAAEVREIQNLVTYGWGMIPAEAQIGETRLTTALWPKEGTYLVPIKASVRKAERIEEGDLVNVIVNIDCDRTV